MIPCVSHGKGNLGCLSGEQYFKFSPETIGHKEVRYEWEVCFSFVKWEKSNCERRLG